MDNQPNPVTTPLPIQFRRARRTDVPAIVRLLADDELGAARESAVEPLPDTYWTAFDAIDAQSGSQLLLAVGEDDRIVGCLQLTLIPGLSLRGTTRALIEAVRIERQLRGQGLGERLIRHALDMARGGGAGIAQLTTDKRRPAARRFYERLGFTASHVGMKLNLA